MKKKISIDDLNFLIQQLSEKYRVITPKAFKNKGKYSYDDDIRYSETS